MSSYSAPGWKSITRVEFLDDLHLYRSIKAVKTRKGRDALYIVGGPFRLRYFLDGIAQIIEVPKEFATDLASVPRLLRSLVGRVGPHLEASVLHDWLYVAWQNEGRQPTKADHYFADRLYLLAMREAKVNRVLARLIYAAVRAFGWKMFST